MSLESETTYQKAFGGHFTSSTQNIIYGQGQMEETKFGARRESNEGRGRFDLMPYEAMESLAKWYEAGADKYGDRNWENGISVKDCINRMIRHAMKAGNGWTDENHLAAVMWNAAAAITMMQRRPDCNDHRWIVHEEDPNKMGTDANEVLESVHNGIFKHVNLSQGQELLVKQTVDEVLHILNTQK